MPVKNIGIFYHTTVKCDIQRQTAITDFLRGTKLNINCSDSRKEKYYIFQVKKCENFYINIDINLLVTDHVFSAPTLRLFAPFCY